MMVVDLKEWLVDRDIYSYSWLPTKNMWADMMTKEMKIHPALEDVIMDLPKPLENEMNDRNWHDQHNKHMSI